MLVSSLLKNSFTFNPLQLDVLSAGANKTEQKDTSFSLMAGQEMAKQAGFAATTPAALVTSDAQKAYSATEASNSARTLFDAQLLGQGGDVTETSSLSTSPKDKFMEFMSSAKEGGGGMMRAQILQSLGLTEDDLKSMSAEDRRKIEEKIEEMVRQKVAEQQRRAVEGEESL